MLVLCPVDKWFTHHPNKLLPIKNKIMKTTINVLMLTIGLLAMQACGSKKNSEANEATAEESVVKEKVALTSAEKKAKLEKQTAERAERRRVENERIVLNTPTYTDSNGNLVYNKTEYAPSFVGGDKAMMAYFKDNLKFPKDALDKQDEGVVFVDFVIAKNGTVREVEVTNLTNEDVDQSFRTEAIRVVSTMPKWIPGRQKGNAVDVKFSLPVSFEIL